MITIVQGDLLEATEDVIAHQVNCQGVMGSGVAVQIKQKFPKAYDEYIKAYAEYEHHNRKESLLGIAQLVHCDNKMIANLFGQYAFGGDRDYKYTNYDAIYTAFVNLDRLLMDNTTIAFPYKIGCDRGGADWDIVYLMMEKVFVNKNITLYQKGE